MTPLIQGLLALSLALNTYASTTVPQLASPPAVKAYIEAKALELGVSPKLATIIADCESGFVPQQSGHITKSGEREDSWGVWQINLPSHPNISRAQAMDVVYSTDWALNELKKGNAWLWTCSPISTKAK